MPQHRNKAVVAGLAVTLAFGGVALPAVANTEQAFEKKIASKPKAFK